MIKNFTPRLYQQTILANCIEKNTLVVLPTGLGKTNVFLMLAASRLKNYPDSKIMLLGPTRPLISQYYEAFKKYFEIDESVMAVFTGDVSPEKRAEISKTAKIIFSTPQGLENDIITGRIDLAEFSLIGFDEAHRATGDYAYVWIAQQYHKKAKNERIIAMTASPGSDLEKITEVCTNLYIENVEVRTDSDPDVAPYMHETKVSWIYLELPSVFHEIKKFLDSCHKSKLALMKEINKDITISVDFSKRELLGLQAQLQCRIIKGDREIELLKSISLLAEALKVQHALELLETQSIASLSQYMEDLVTKARSTKTKAVQNLVRDLNFRSALIKTRTLKELKIEHPKLAELKKLISERVIKNSDTKIIVFSQYRDSITKIVDELNKIPNIKAKMFVGQAKKRDSGLSQKKQIEMLKDFENASFNVICMTSVGEEGLDIPSVNTVIFYEPIPSAIRTIQRKGRTGRHAEGEMIVLVAKGTRDEAYRWTAFHKEKNMHKILDTLKDTFEAKKNKTISEYIKSDEVVTIYADYREKASGVVKKLIDLGVKINLDTLEVGDYVLGARSACEFKTVPDFVDSIIDKRLLNQAKNLKKYESPFIIIEGEENIFSQRNINPNAISGMMATLIIDFKIPILSTKNPDETARLLYMIARHEQCEKESGFTFHSNKPLTLKEQQEYIVSALPGVGGILAKPLLMHFSSIKNIVNASTDELKEVDLIGEKKAGKIRDILDSKYYVEDEAKNQEKNSKKINN
ncbi:MAG: DEAD/DEAH box helicase [archaeon]